MFVPNPTTLVSAARTKGEGGKSIRRIMASNGKENRHVRVATLAATEKKLPWNGLAFFLALENLKSVEIDAIVESIQRLGGVRCQFRQALEIYLFLNFVELKSAVFFKFHLQSAENFYSKKVTHVIVSSHSKVSGSLHFRTSTCEPIQ
jgi:hypothetical protein